MQKYIIKFRNIKITGKILILGIILGTIAGFIDAVWDYSWYYKDSSFIDILIFDVPFTEIIVRVALLFHFIAFSLIVNIFIDKINKMNSELDKNNEGLEKEIKERTNENEQTILELDLLTRKLTDENYERSMIETSLRESEEKYRTLLEQIPVGIYRATKEGSIIHCNNALSKILGYDNTIEIIGTNINDFYLSSELRNKVIDESVTTKERYNAELQLINRERNIIWVRESGRIISSEYNETVYIDGILEDITEQKQIEAALVWEANLNISVAKLSKSIISTSNIYEISEIFLRHSLRLTNSPQGFICYINVKAGNLVLPAYSFDNNIIRPSEKEIKLIDITDQLLNQLISEKKIIILNQVDTVINSFHLNGIDLPLSRIIAIPVVVDDNVFGVIACLNSERNYSDLDTEVLERISSLYSVALRRLKADEEINTALDKVKELNELKTRFIQMVSHEYRTPLQEIMLSVELLKNYKDKMTSEDKKAKLDKISDSLKSMNKLLDKVMLINKVDNGRVEFIPFEFDLFRFCEDLINNTLIETRHKCPIAYLYNSKRRKAYIDPVIVQEIMQILVNNAVKYSSPDSVIELKIEEAEEGIAIIVKDNGCGIPEPEKNRIFTPFYRGSNTGNSTGTGLGLSVAKNLVNLINGKISFESTENKGTEFRVYIPEPVRKKINLSLKKDDLVI